MTLTEQKIDQFLTALRRGPSGYFITFEGIDGSGKSTQRDRLATRLADHQVNALLTREPGGTQVGLELRRLILKGGTSPRTELLLFAADRVAHVDEVILPALTAGRVVISDRFVDSTRVYQKVCRGLPSTLIEQVLTAIHVVTPDVTVLLDASAPVAWQRLTERNAKSGAVASIFEADIQQLAQCAMALEYRALAASCPRFVRINADQNEDQVAEDVFAAIVEHAHRAGRFL